MDIRPRICTLNHGKMLANGPLLYWMSRDQRAHDNWALLYAQKLALQNKQPLIVVFNRVADFLGAQKRQFNFMLAGLAELSKELYSHAIPLIILTGDPAHTIPRFAAEHKASAVVTDFSPLHLARAWHSDVARKIAIPLYEVDAHNVIPVWEASPKQEFAARTIRPKIHALLPEYLVEFPKLKKHPYLAKMASTRLPIVTSDYTAKSGEQAARRVLKHFITDRLAGYDTNRNDPTLDGQSNLSAYLHFGQLSAARVALEVKKSDAPHKDKETFLEELIVRRELAENFCFYNKNYDSFDGFPAWAQKTLNEHRKDKREFTYTLKEFEAATTHDELWNAAQKEMMVTGKMQGFMRMYWAKKILEWSKNPEEALETAIYLNDTYELDGRDPNGYTGIAWSIGGVHDRPWFNRPIFGTVRYMNRSGCEKKFDVKAYIKKFS